MVNNVLIKDKVVIRELIHLDWPDVERIYLEGIATGNATFQVQAPSWEDWERGHLKKLRYVAIVDDIVVGWIALSAASSRVAYSGVFEVSIYIGKNFRGMQLGYLLIKHLIAESEKQNIWTLQVSIFPNNFASIKLHEKAGFRIIGYREKIAQLDGIWYDNIIMERRSKVVGVN